VLSLIRAGNFHGARPTSRCPCERRALFPRVFRDKHLLHLTCFQCLPPVKKKRQLFLLLAPPSCLVLCFTVAIDALSCIAARLRFSQGAVLCLLVGEYQPHSLLEVCPLPHRMEPILSANGYAPSLGPTHPCPIAVHTEPSSTSVFNPSPQLNTCYFHQDLHWGLLHAASRQRFHAFPIPKKIPTPTYLAAPFSSCAASSV